MTAKFSTGSVFCITDNKKLPSNEQYKCHNYIILGKSPHTLGFVQAMCITSMRDKDVEMEVPIVLTNNYISYVVPHNMHSFFDADITIQSYKGIITDTEIISRNDFLQLLRDIYLDGLGLCELSHAEVKAKYDTYCKAFFEAYKDAEEYRFKKDESREDITTTEEVTTQNATERKNLNPSKPAKVSRSNKYKRSYESKADIRMKRELTRNSSQIDITPEETSNNNNSGDNDEPVVYRSDSLNSINTIKIPAEVTQAISNIEKTNADKIHTNPKTWSDTELLQFIQIMDSHKGDPQFRLDFTGFTIRRAVDDKVYAARKEARRRKLVTN